jgi:cytochrome c biogenesis protein
MTLVGPRLLTQALVYPRRAWRRLTSMRTALILLFLLAVAAVPGSLLPQRPLNPSLTRAYIVRHGRWGVFLDRVGMFDVFGSPWFAAIYLLLGISLVGCLVPRIRVHARALRTPPLPAPKRLNRLPESATLIAAGSPEALMQQAKRALGRRWRTRARAEQDGVVTLSAEKGYLRETGNLIFHIALLVAVIAIAVDRLYYAEGNVVVQQGQGFCNTAVGLDSLRTGRLTHGLAPICVDNLNSFTAGYTPAGEAISFAADITYSIGASGAPRRHTITVNNPLRIDGDRVYLTGHGFAPRITVRMPDGTTRTTTTTFLPQDALFTSTGAIKLQGTGTGGDVGIEGVFAPDGVQNAAGQLISGSPQPLHPTLTMFIYQGDLGLGNGAPQNVYSLDATQKATGGLRRIGAATLTVGQSTTLPGGVQVGFDGYSQWANLQISHNPGQDYLLLAVIFMVVGLVGSLTIRRRRLWLRITPVEGDELAGHVDVGGLARSDSGNFTNEFTALCERLSDALPPPLPDPVPLEGADQ